jgi:hypothetical protein
VNVDKIANIFAGITTVALVTTIVGSPNTAAIIRAMGNAYTGGIRAAMGR